MNRRELTNGRRLKRVVDPTVELSSVLPTAIMIVGAGIVSGKEIVSLNLANGLRANGWNVKLLTSRWGDGEFVRRLEAEKFDYRRLWLGFISASLRWSPFVMTLDQLRRWPHLIIRYVQIIRSSAPAIVIHTNWHHALLLLPFLNRRRDIYWAHEVIEVGDRSAPVFRLIAKRVAAIACVSRAVADSFIATGVKPEKLCVIHNGVPLPAAIPPLLAERRLRLGIVGQIGDWKGHGDLLEALAIACGSGTQVILKIFGAGDDNYIAALKQKAGELGIDHCVEWCGYVRDREFIFRSIDVCVVPSRFPDPLPTSAIEASGFGRPVVCSARGGLVEIVEHGVTGLLVDAKSPDQLSKAIRTLADDRELVLTMGKAARERAEREFTQDRFTVRFLDLIDDLGARQGRPIPRAEM
jgi:glycosyltransferase involved in cell wall biosynthesis